MTLRAYFTSALVLTVGLLLAACSSSTHAGTVSDPLPVAEEYITATYQLPEGLKVTCLSKGAGKSAVLACVEAASPDVAALPLAESSYTHDFRELEDGRTVVCLSKGAGKSAVLSCLPYVR